MCTQARSFGVLIRSSRRGACLDSSSAGVFVQACVPLPSAEQAVLSVCCQTSGFELWHQNLVVSRQLPNEESISNRIDGRWDHKFLDSGDNAGRSLRVSVTSCSSNINHKSNDTNVALQLLELVGGSVAQVKVHGCPREPRAHPLVQTRFWKDLPQHCLQIGQDTPSALQCNLPGRCCYLL